MRRREFITLVGAAAAWSLPLNAQQRTPRVGVLLFGVAPGTRPTSAFESKGCR